MMFAVAERVIINAVNRGRAATRVHDCKINTWRALDRAARDLVCRESAISRIPMDAAARGD